MSTSTPNLTQNTGTTYYPLATHNIASTSDGCNIYIINQSLLQVEESIRLHEDDPATAYILAKIENGVAMFAITTTPPLVTQDVESGLAMVPLRGSLNAMMLQPLLDPDNNLYSVRLTVSGIGVTDIISMDPVDLTLFSVAFGHPTPYTRDRINYDLGMLEYVTLEFLHTELAWRLTACYSAV